MVQPGTNPSPDEPFRDQDASPQSDPGLEGVVEELRNVLSGLGHDTVETAAPVEPVQPPVADVHFPFSPVDEPAPSEPLNGSTPDPAQNQPTPSDADFWNGNVLGWADKEPQNAQPSVSEEAIAPVEPFNMPVSESEPDFSPEPELERKPAKRSSIEDLLPPLPPSPFEVEETVAAPKPSAPPPIPQPEPPPAQVISPLLDRSTPPMEMAPPPPPAQILPPVEILPPSRPPMEHAPIPASIDQPVPAAAVPPAASVEEDPAIVEVPMEKPEGLVQIACIFPKGFEKQGQHFVTTLRSACVAARLKMVIQPVYIQPWSPEGIDAEAWVKAARQAGADRMFVLVAKKEQDKIRSVIAQAVGAGLASRLVFIEHVGLRTLYADILVDMRRP